MKAQTHILFAKLFDSGGSNSHFKLLVQYFTSANIVLVLENKDQLTYLENITTERFKKIKVIPWLPAHVQTRYKQTTNIKNILLLACAYLRILLLSMRYGLSDITISSVEPERYLYLLALPFVRVRYILHSLPGPAMNPFTVNVCNVFLGARKQIITVSKSMKNAITENWQIAESRSKYVRVVYNSLLDAPKQSVQLRSKSSDITVMTLGHVDGRKNPSIWFEAAKILTTKYPSVRFEWFGNGPLLTHFQSLAADFDNIHFRGHSLIAQQQLHAASIYYQPSIIEPQGIAVLEAMNNKLPCVVSNVGGLPESVINGYNGYVVSATDVDEHVRAISSMIEDKDLRKQFGENSYARYNKLFTYASFKSEMDAIYKCA